MNLILATANPDKAAEIRAILERPGLVLIERPDGVPEVDEDGDTLVANALKKARALVEATGEAAVADDTGLFVDALGGDPGIYAARYAGPGATYADNVNKLLREMKSTGPGARRARFVTVAALCRPDGSSLVVEGVLEGEIAPAPRGAGGFGYDPVFVPRGSGGRTLAELTVEEKNADSHRARAFTELARRLAD